MIKKSCDRCIWFESCGEAEACEYYDPVLQEEADEAAVLEYGHDLKNRRDMYSELVEEQQS